MLWAILDAFQPQRIIEFGMGMYSTPVFLARIHSGLSQFLLSIEQTDEEWFERVAAWTTPGFQPEFWKGDTGRLMAGNNTPFDFAFIDGDTAERYQDINWCIYNGIPVIAFHDSEKPDVYHYDRIDPVEYNFCHYMSQVEGANYKSTCVMMQEPYQMLSPLGHLPVEIRASRSELVLP